MGATKAKRHTHKYHRIPVGSGYVWACALPDCNHYMHQSMIAMVVGKNSICYGCLNVFILEPDNMSYSVEHNNGDGLCNICIAKLQGIEPAPEIKAEKSVAEIIQELEIAEQFGK